MMLQCTVHRGHVYIHGGPECSEDYISSITSCFVLYLPNYEIQTHVQNIFLKYE